nr:hypothetical protein GCM10020093_052800 [Planobispora longispora]
MPGRYPVTFGEVDLLRDLDRSSGWVISKDGVPQSYVDLDDPTYLDFEYVQLMADVIDLLDEGPLDVAHIGGCACTLPRYVAATRPGSRQIVAEPDGALVQLVRDQLRLKSVPRLKVRILDGRTATTGLHDASADLLVLDAFSGATMPIDLATREYMGDVARVLRPAGTLLVNIADGKGLAFARRVLATIRATFPTWRCWPSPGAARPQVRQPHRRRLPHRAPPRRHGPQGGGRPHPGPLRARRRPGQVHRRGSAAERRRPGRHPGPAARRVRLTGGTRTTDRRSPPSADRATRTTARRACETPRCRGAGARPRPRAGPG